MKVKSTIKINEDAIAGIEQRMKVALQKTAEETVTDLHNSQTIPFDIGTLQGNTKWTRNPATENEVVIASNTKYARRLYHHPEYNFRKTNNPNAGAYWFEPYITGSKKDFIITTFARFLKRGD